MALPQYVCKDIEGPIEVDANLAKPEWKGVEAVKLVLVDSGKPPEQSTTVRILYDETYLYFAFHVIDNDIWSTFRQRDEELSEEEVVEMFIDPLGTGKIYFEFNISPHNVVFDSIVLNAMVPPDGPRDINGSKSWNCKGLKTAVHIEGELDTRRPVSEYWDVEAAVPFHDIVPPHCPPEPGDEWRLNLFRIDRGKDKDEYQAWSPTGRIDFHMPWYFGKLIFSGE